VKYPVVELVKFAQRLLAATGLDEDKAATVAELLVRADAMGHTTHGLAQLGDYLAELESGRMATTGVARVICDRGATVVWDGRRLPGVWLTSKAMELAIARARQYGVCAVSIRRSHHIACLASFLPDAIDAGMMAILASSDPSDAMVAPYGGTQAVFTPDPIAVAIPTEDRPILVDMSSSITTVGMSARLRRNGQRFPGQWAIDASGVPTNDPDILKGNPPGTLLPVGGTDHGHKGYGLALMVEALTQGLSGYGRADNETGWGASVFLQVLDPQAFAGFTSFTRQTTWIARACIGSPPAKGDQPVRLPGSNAVAGYETARIEGVDVAAEILDGLRDFAEKCTIAPPRPSASGGQAI
jgi:LDH2 family malate/lactate/ureidoglycolate dehydrogenase